MPEAWLQQSHLLHPDKVSPVEDAQPMRNWSRQPLPVQDAEVKDAAASAPPAPEEPGATHNRPDEYGDFS
jgi:acetyl-CoA acetyltransferase